LFIFLSKGHVELDPELEMYREKGIINGQEVAMLRDTGCTETLVHSSLVPKRSIIPKRWVNVCLTDGSSKQLPMSISCLLSENNVCKSPSSNCVYTNTISVGFILDFSTFFPALCTCIFSSLSQVDIDVNSDKVITDLDPDEIRKLQRHDETLGKIFRLAIP
jgi:hypothetical protein